VWALKLAETRWPPSAEISDIVFSDTDLLVGRFFKSEWSWKKMAENALRRPLTELWSLEFNIDSAKSADEAKAVLRQAGQFGRRIEASLTLAFADGLSMWLRLFAMGDDDYAVEPASSNYQYYERSDWRMLMASAVFRMNPTSGGLAEALRQLSSVWDAGFREDVAYRVPWPVGACIINAKGQDNLLEMADAAQKGEMGDREAWKIAEERWSRGITLEDLAAFEDHGCQIGAYMVNRGYPLTCARIRGVRTGGAVETEALFRCFEQLRSARMKAYIGRQIIDLMALDGMNNKRWKWLSGEKLKSLVSSHDRKYFGLETVLVLPDDAYHTEQHNVGRNVLDVLDIVGRDCEIWTGPDPNLTRISQVASDGLRVYPELDGLLHVLALCAPYTEVPALSAGKLDFKRQSDSRLRTAALVLSAQRCATQSGARELGKRLAAAASDGCGHILRAAVQLVAKGRIEQRLGAAFVAELYSNIACNWQMYAIVGAGIDDLLRRRRSLLNEGATLERLGLTTLGTYGSESSGPRISGPAISS
jgi:hypothetical protein